MPIFYVSSFWLFEGMRKLGHTEIGEIVVSVVSSGKFSPTVVFPLDQDLGVLLTCHILCLVLICLQIFWAFVLVVPLLVALITLHALEVSVCVQ